MKNFKISFVEHLSEEITDKMEKGLHEYEISQWIEVNYKPLSF